VAYFLFGHPVYHAFGPPPSLRCMACTGWRKMSCKLSNDCSTAVYFKTTPFTYKPCLSAFWKCWKTLSVAVPEILNAIVS